MSFNTGLSPNSPKRYVGSNLAIAIEVIRNRAPTSADYRQPENGKLYQLATFWIVGINPTTGTQGDIWYLAKIVANVAFWMKLSGGSSGPLVSFLGGTNTTGFPITGVVPNVLGQITINTDTNIAINGATANSLSFSLVGGHGIDKIITDTGGTGLFGATINLNSAVPYNTGTGPNALAVTNSTATQGNIALQLAGSNASTLTANNFGISQFDSNQFNVVGGFVQLKGGTTPSLLTLSDNAGTKVQPDSTGNIELAAGSGIATLSTSASHLITISTLSQPGFSNLGLTNTSGTTLTVNAADGSSLATKPAYVTLQSYLNPGQLVTYKISANQSVTQANLAGNAFHINGSVDYAVPLPMFVYVASNSKASVSPETIASFFLSPFPNTTVTPVAAKIATATSAVANSQGSFFSLNGAITVADYASSPCLCIGSLRMTYVASGTLWTFSTFNRGDGVGEFQLDQIFSVPLAQFGAATGSWWYANGGTAPKLSGGGVNYSVSRSNIISLNAAVGSPTVNGAGNVPFQLATPYVFGGIAVGSGYVISGANSPNSTNVVVLVGDRTSAHLNAIEMYYASASVSFSEVFNANIGAGAGLNDTLGYSASCPIAFS